jgi:hypothetical protein
LSGGQRCEALLRASQASLHPVHARLCMALSPNSAKHVASTSVCCGVLRRCNTAPGLLYKSRPGGHQLIVSRRVQACFPITRLTCPPTELNIPRHTHHSRPPLRREHRFKRVPQRLPPWSAEVDVSPPCALRWRGVGCTGRPHAHGAAAHVHLHTPPPTTRPVTQPQSCT